MDLFFTGNIVKGQDHGIPPPPPFFLLIMVATRAHYRKIHNVVWNFFLSVIKYFSMSLNTFRKFHGISCTMFHF